MVALSPVRTPVSRLHRTKTSPAQFPPHEIERGARALWARSGYGVLTNVEPVAYGGTLVLRGRVPSYFHKQLAQEIAARVAGVRHIQNEIEVEGY